MIRDDPKWCLLILSGTPVTPDHDSSDTDTQPAPISDSGIRKWECEWEWEWESKSKSMRGGTQSKHVKKIVAWLMEESNRPGGGKSGRLKGQEEEDMGAYL